MLSSVLKPQTILVDIESTDKDSLFVCGGCNAKIGAGTLSKILKNQQIFFSFNQ